MQIPLRPLLPGSPAESVPSLTQLARHAFVTPGASLSAEDGILPCSLAPPSRLFLRRCEERQLLVHDLAEHGIRRGATEKMAVNEKARRAG